MEAAAPVKGVATKAMQTRTKLAAVPHAAIRAFRPNAKAKAKAAAAPKAMEMEGFGDDSD